LIEYTPVTRRNVAKRCSYNSSDIRVFLPLFPLIIYAMPFRGVNSLILFPSSLPCTVVVISIREFSHVISTIYRFRFSSDSHTLPKTHMTPCVPTARDTWTRRYTPGLGARILQGTWLSDELFDRMTEINMSRTARWSAS